MVVLTFYCQGQCHTSVNRLPSNRRYAIFPSLPTQDIPKALTTIPNIFLLRIFIDSDTDTLGNPQGDIQGYLRVYPKYTSELFVVGYDSDILNLDNYGKAEYMSLERVFAHPVLLASWVLPSSHPYFSVVLLRAPLRDAICCDPFSNVCVTTIGGKQRRRHRQTSFDRGYPQMGTSNHYDRPVFPAQSLYDIMGPSKEERCSSPSCSTCNDDDRSECLSCATSRLLLNADSIRISEADPEACCCASFSEPLTLENDVYESDSKEDSEMPRRKPYTTEASSSTSRGNPPESSSQRSRRSYSQSVTRNEKTGGRSETVTAEREALSILQNLESFFGLKTTSIGSSRPADSRAGTDWLVLVYTYTYQ
ncbi:unnamed protein product [Haemonchus placei]|uniref:Sema domain-containing protein n=1 Tax=Haemonchus placei TaxID=6290 RepID=A0A0N4WEV3_HAEPC|nr:unnamed protein product [Haemonchus placei]